MTPEQMACLDYTISHFQEIARQNRFPENNLIEHDEDRCVICNPDLLPQDAFVTYLEVVTESIKIRRPALDGELVDEINGDLELLGSSLRFTLEDFLSDKEDAVHFWKNWLKDAIETGLELISIHSATSREFDLSEAESCGWRTLIEEKTQQLLLYQKANASV